MAELPNVRLNLANTPENVVLVRAVLSGIAETAGLDGNDLGDIRTAVTEACNNVVLHAYEGERGPLDVDLELGEDSLWVCVRDRGVGIGDRAAGLDGEPIDGVAIGLHVIRTLTRNVEFEEPPGGGTRARMEFSAPGLRGLEPRLTVGPDRDLAGTMASSEAAISIAPVSLARAVVPRLASALAARAHFSTDRISDVQLLADALAAHAADAVCEKRLSLGISVQPREVQLRVAPLRPGHGQSLLRASHLDGFDRVIETLADSHEVVEGDSHETLAVSMLDRRPR